LEVSGFEHFGKISSVTGTDRNRPAARRGVVVCLRVVFGLLAASTVAAYSSGAGQRPPAAAPPAAAATAASTDPRARLDEALRLASERKYDAAIAAFEAVKTQHADAINGLDGLKMAVVYAEVGKDAKHAELTRWLVDRYRTPKTATEAERSVKGYIVYRRAKDPALLARGVEMTTYASDHAAADGEGEYQGFFDTSRGIAQFRVAHFAEAARWFPKTIDHPSLYVRCLALPFFAMTERARGNRAHAQELYAQALAAAADLPQPGTPEYGVQWTDILIARMALQEAKAAFGR
jgi:tetratricopeptide (TPR) repeat protein